MPESIYGHIRLALIPNASNRLTWRVFATFAPGFPGALVSNLWDADLHEATSVHYQR